MIRTQIQLSAEQAKALKRLAQRDGKSVAELIRISVEKMLSSEGGLNPEEQRQKALAAAGCLSTGPRDLAEKHDEYLAEVFES